LNYRVLLHPKAADFLRRLNSPLREKIKGCLRELEKAPEEKGQRLKHSSFYRLRIGDYRAIYEIHPENREVVILFIGHRRKVYDEFSRIL